MAQVAIIVNGTPDPRKSEISSALGILLGCPVLKPSAIHETLTQATGPVAPRDDIRTLAIETAWRTAGLVEAGVVIDAFFETGDAGAVTRGIEFAGSPRVVEVWCGAPDGELGLTPFVRVDAVDTVDMDALVQEISALFV